jgi:hypothetical protein
MQEENSILRTKYNFTIPVLGVLGVMHAKNAHGNAEMLDSYFASSEIWDFFDYLLLGFFSQYCFSAFPLLIPSP